MGREAGLQGGLREEGRDGRSLSRCVAGKKKMLSSSSSSSSTRERIFVSRRARDSAAAAVCPVLCVFN